MDDSTKLFLRFLHHNEQCSMWARDFVAQDLNAAIAFAKAMIDAKTFEDFERTVEIDGEITHFKLLAGLACLQINEQLRVIFQGIEDNRNGQRPNEEGE